MRVLNKVVPTVMTLALLSPSLRADTEFGDTVPREVVEQFAEDPRGVGPGKVYSDILDSFPRFTVPEGYTVLASADQGYYQRVILKTTDDEAAAKVALLATFVPEGWLEIPDLYSGAQQTGFDTTQDPVQLCNDALGRMTVNVTTSGSARYAALIYNANDPAVSPEQQTCTEQIEIMTMRGRMGPDLSQYLPQLFLPESGASDMRVPGSFGEGGSSSDWYAGGTLFSDMSVDEIIERFTSQIAAQGWVADSAATGTLVATASWTKTVDGMNLIGLLTLVATAENNWDMKFRIVRKSSADPGIGRDPIR